MKLHKTLVIKYVPVDKVMLNYCLSILRISLIETETETESNPTRVKNTRGHQYLLTINIICLVRMNHKKLKLCQVQLVDERQWSETYAIEFHLLPQSP